MTDPWIVLAAGALEGLVGYPDRLHARLPHPVAWLGGVISALERAWNRPGWPAGVRRALGVGLVLIVAGGAGLAGLLLERLGGRFQVEPIMLVVFGAFGLAGRSLYDHVIAVARALRAGDLAAARIAVGRIVGRDVAALDETGVAVAALESLAESFNDALAAPLFWFVLAGLPGLFAYKAINTADSIIGHKEPRWCDFGWAAARTDDLVNPIPARLAGGLLVLAAGWGAAGRGLMTMIRDAPKHASPNAGWPEAAMAGALKVRLGGPVTYDGVLHDRPVFGDGSAATTPDLTRGLALYLRACALLAVGLLVGGLFWPR